MVSLAVSVAVWKRSCQFCQRINMAILPVGVDSWPFDLISARSSVLPVAAFNLCRRRWMLESWTPAMATAARVISSHHSPQVLSLSSGSSQPQHVRCPKVGTDRNCVLPGLFLSLLPSDIYSHHIFLSSLLAHAFHERNMYFGLKALQNTARWTQDGLHRGSGNASPFC